MAAPPAKGELAGAIAELAEHTWRHPTTSEPTRFGFSTIERWYYRALKEKRDPVGVLRRKLRADAGQQPAMTAAVRQLTLAQYAAHKSWSAQLHHDNLVVLAESNPDRHLSISSQSFVMTRSKKWRLYYYIGHNVGDTSSRSAHDAEIRDAVVSPARQKLLRYLTYPLQRRKASPLCQFLP